MTLALLSGLGLGLGLCLLFAGLHPARPSLATSLHRLDHPTGRPVTTPPITPGALPITDQARVWLGRQLRQHATPASDPTGAGGWQLLPMDIGETTAADLAVTGTPVELHTGAKVFAALIGLLTPALLAALFAVTGLMLPLLVPLWLSLTGAVVGFLLPDLRLRRAAADARRTFRTSVGAFLDLVAMRMASGSGLSEALHDAASIGAGPAFARIRGALADARTDGLSPAQALGRLGEQLHLPDLIDTSTRLRLVDTSGAQAQTSLRAQAASLRDRELADAQGRAGEQSQSMLVAQVVLGLGFVLFLGYPAVARVLAT